MSDYYTRIITSDPEYVPGQERTEAAIAFVAQLGWNDPAVVIHDVVKFIDAGENTFADRLDCSRCAYDLLDGRCWVSAMDAAYALVPQFSDLWFSCPSCEARLSLNQLRYATDVGFSRWVVEAFGYAPISDVEIQALGDVVGHPVRAIFAKI